MVYFNELRIANGVLIIDVSIPNESYFENVYLDSIIIDNQDSYLSSGPSSNPVYEYTVPDIVSEFTQESHSQKSIRLMLDSHDVPIGDMLFVYVRTKGTPAPDTPCGLDNITTMATVIDLLPFYQQAMQYIKELGATCNVPQGFADFILRFKSLELGIKTGNYPQAINYFNRFFNGKTTYVSKGGCGCGNS
jgi:hypothetical protein